MPMHKNNNSDPVDCEEIGERREEVCPFLSNAATTISNDTASIIYSSRISQ